MIDVNSLDFPIVRVIPQFLKDFEQEHTLILKAETGAGKSTILPLALIDYAKKLHQKIIMLEPRRLAAKSIAQRMADLLNEPLGKTVGYSIRFESAKSEETIIEVVTEGILTKMLVTDPELTEYCTVIFDEFHERSIHADLGLALAKSLQQKKRNDLKLIIMSATFNEDNLAASLKAHVIKSAGRSYPVTIKYAGEQSGGLIEETIAHQIITASKQQQGDILVFLPGQGEILKVHELLRNQLNDVLVCPLYGQLPWHKQQRAILPDNSGRRRVVLATSIAETSLTIEGIKIVVDSGLGRNSIYNPKNGLSGLVTEAISQDEADQRSGRAGRLVPGICYRMWSESAHMIKKPHRTPEILVNDLSPLLLDLYAKNISDTQALFWVTPPPIDKIYEAEKLLTQLEAISNNAITVLGKEMNLLPCHPRLAHMLKHELANDNLALATDIAALLEEKDTFYRELGADLSSRIDRLHALRAENRLSKPLKRIEKVAKRYRELIKIEADNSQVDAQSVGFLLALAYPDRIATAKRGNNAQFQLANGAIAAVGHKDELAHESWLTVASMDARQGLGKIFLAAPLNPTDLKPLIKNTETPVWDYDNDAFELNEELRIGNIILSSEFIDDDLDQQEKKQAVINAIQTDEEHELLRPEASFEAFCQQINTLRIAYPDEGFPAMSVMYLKKLVSIWLPDSIIEEEDIITALLGLDLTAIGKNMLTDRQQEVFNSEDLSV